MKYSFRNRILSAILAIFLLMEAVPMPALSVDSTDLTGDSSTEQTGGLRYDYDTLSITQDGEEITELAIFSYDKVEIEAEGLTELADYQWQVEHPEQDGIWINIYDGTEQSISITMALVSNVLREDGTARLRCRATTDTYAYLSAPVIVTVLSEEPVSAAGYALMTAADDGDDSSSGATPEFVTITIEYILYAYVLQGDAFVMEEIGSAFTPYVATLKSQTSLENTEVHCPTIVGYEPTLVKVTEGSTERTPLDGEFRSEGDDDFVVINQTEVTGNVVYRVEYHPAQVKYEVRYFFQNIYDDLYVEDTGVVYTNTSITSYPVEAEGYTGQHPNKDYTEAEFSGFTSLYYEPETIAADGSTVFNVYYERNYYLMEFDCAGGYGTDTVYVRYGTYVSVPSPVRSGWVFAGWDLVQTGESDPPALGTGPDANGRYSGDGIANPLPANMPPYNSAYKALWTQADTTYTVAYWTIDNNGNRTFLGSHQEEGLSNDTVSGKDDLGTTDGAICGELEHAHTESCFTCDLEEAQHEGSCFEIVSLGDSFSNNSDYYAILAANGGVADTQGAYIYLIQAGSDAGNNKYWPKLFLNGTYYNITVSGSDHIYGNSDVWNNLLDGEEISRGTANGYTAFKYKPKTSCEHHSHVESCTTCKFDEHTHTDSCYLDTRNLEYVESLTIEVDGEEVTFEADKNVTIEGDGSTVVNVYYQYKEYTLKFYYAASSTTTDGTTTYSVVGGSTYYFGGQHVIADYSDFNNYTTMDMLNRMFGTTSQLGQTDGVAPSLNAKGQQRVTDGIYTLGSDYDSTSGRTYYYLSFRARYGDDISQKWPCDVLSPVTMKEGNTNSSWTEDYAVASAWNGEHHVWYSKNMSNETIKGVYEKLDYKLLYDSSFDDSTTVSYLCFWENGAPNIGWNIPELYRYNIYLETYDGQDTTGLTTIERNGTLYYLADSYNTCDNSSVAEQSPPSIAGYASSGQTWGSYFISNTTKDDSGTYYIGDDKKYANGVVYSGSWNYEVSLSVYELGNDEYLIYDKTKYDPYNPDTVINHEVYREAYDVNFFYDSADYTLTFWNHNDYLTDGTGVEVAYGTPLQKYGAYVNGEYMKDHYPTGLEPGAYEFAGWYTTELCLPGTEVDWTTLTMPDADLMVYAYWKPVIHNVYFYYDYEDYTSAFTANGDNKRDYYWYPEGEDVTYPVEVEHGKLLGTAYSKIPAAKEGYTFVGWFYIDETGKKRFAPDTMEVKKELHLFAEWQSGVDTRYSVSYVLNENTTIGDTTYPAGTTIANVTTGHLTAGKTKTFTAKVGTELLDEFQSASLFPTVNSHSILMGEMNGDGSSPNTYEFTYVYDEVVWYRVRYVDKITGLDLCEEKIESSPHAIVTEKFVPIDNYIPDNYYIRKVLASDGEDGSEENISEYNEIIFYYTPDEDHGLYVIEYYTENLDGTWHLEQSALGSDDLNNTVTVTVDTDKFDGFTYSETKVTTYDGSGNATEIPSKETTISGKVTETGLEIRVYYTRNSYPYTIQYVEYGTGKVLFKETKTDDDAARFQSTVSHTAEDTYSKDSIQYLFYTTAEKPQSQTMTIRASDSENVMTFYYQAKTVSIYYKAVCHTVGAIDYGGVSLNHESATTTANIAGSTAIPGEGFAFKGWYTDETCTNQVSTYFAWKPTTLDTSVDSVTYYALFEPIITQLKITKQVGTATTDNFLFHVKGIGKTAYIDLIVSINGSGSVAIKDLPIGDYQITELTGWCWEYTLQSVTATCEKGGTYSISENIVTYKAVESDGDGTDENVIIFNNTAVTSDWLGGECRNENIFDGVSAP